LLKLNLQGVTTSIQPGSLPIEQEKQTQSTDATIILIADPTPARLTEEQSSLVLTQFDEFNLKQINPLQL
jgi:hypothetical protein